jgi:hypothetical protein
VRDRSGAQHEDAPFPSGTRRELALHIDGLISDSALRESMSASLARLGEDKWDQAPALAASPRWAGPAGGGRGEGVDYYHSAYSNHRGLDARLGDEVPPSPSSPSFSFSKSLSRSARSMPKTFVLVGKPPEGGPALSLYSPVTGQSKGRPASPLPPPSASQAGGATGLGPSELVNFMTVRGLRPPLSLLLPAQRAAVLSCMDVRASTAALSKRKAELVDAAALRARMEALRVESGGAPAGGGPEGARAPRSFDVLSVLDLSPTGHGMGLS